MWWIPSLNYRVEYLVFKVNGYHIIWVLYQNLDYGLPSFVKKDVIILIEASTRNQCKGKTLRLHCLCLSFSIFFLIIWFDFGLARVGDVLIWKLENKFLTHGVMNALEIVYA